ncbi:hypothetical protein [Sorangium sp. So ce693]|uniref:hypothetical protein n=1 Tax=Sorangium sp. So ce693 TaxID=3133318 RepID=UPI003F5E614C
MCGTAAHLVDRVLPDVPVRQWVLTTPFAVRRLLALRPDALTAAGRIFVEELGRWQKQKATERATPGGETGSVTFVQRFDSTLGSFVHFHVVALDGVFTRQDGPEVVFHEGPAPSRDDIAAVAARVEKRMGASRGSHVFACMASPSRPLRRGAAARREDSNRITA